MSELMEKIFEKAKAEGIAEYQITTVNNMVERGYQDDEISAVTGVPIKKVAEIRSGVTA